MKRFLTVAAGLSLSFGLSGWVWAQPAVVETKQPAAKEGVVERWYVLKMQGQRAGYVKSVEKTAGDRVTSTTDMHIEIKRGPLNFTMLVGSEFVETLDGKPVSMSGTQSIGAGPTTTSSVFTADGIETTTTAAGQKSTSKKPLPPEGWLTPAASERFVKAELAKGSKEIKFRTIDPSEGDSVLEITRKVVGNEDVEIFGRSAPAVKWISTVNTHPGLKMTEYVDTDGETLKTVIDLGGISIEQLAADKDLALSKLDAPELLDSTMVRPTGARMGDPRRLSRAKYRLSVAKDEMPTLPNTAGQTFTRESPKVGVIDVDMAGVEPVKDADLAAVKAKHLASSTMLKADDPVILGLVKQAHVEGLKDAAAAEKLREFVYSYISKKNMSVGFATASETARTKTGDCTEHAVLLAAMMRAAGIPSRCASGLLCIEDEKGPIFGYHMWTQALVEQKGGGYAWQNFDAVLHSSPYDATHVLLSLTGLEDGEMQNFLVNTAPLIGQLKIEVVEAK